MGASVCWAFVWDGSGSGGLRDKGSAEYLAWGFVPGYVIAIVMGCVHVLCAAGLAHYVQPIECQVFCGPFLIVCLRQENSGRRSAQCFRKH